MSGQFDFSIFFNIIVNNILLYLFEDPTKMFAALNAKRTMWVKVNRIRSNHGRAKKLLARWNPVRCAPNCRCGAAIQDFYHIIKDGPLPKFNGSFWEIHEEYQKQLLCWPNQINNVFLLFFRQVFLYCALVNLYE